MIGVVIEFTYENGGSIEIQLEMLPLHHTLILTGASPVEKGKQTELMHITKVPTGWLYSMRRENQNSITGLTDWETTFVPKTIITQNFYKGVRMEGESV